MAQLGSYQWVWYADVVLALLAAVVNLPIQEAVPSRFAPSHDARFATEPAAR